MGHRSPAGAPDIEVLNPPRDPNPATGLFAVTVVTRRDGQPSNRRFMATSHVALDIRQETSDGLTAVREFVPWSEGIYHLQVGSEGTMATVNFVADSAATEVVLCK